MASIAFITTAKLIELVQQADAAGGMFVRVLSSTHLALGKDPTSPTLAIDLSRESVSFYTQEESKITGVREFTPSHDVVEKMRATRQSGQYWHELLGKRTTSRSLREMLGAALREIEAARPGTFEKLTLIKPRSRRIVARDKRLLFATAEQAEEFGERLTDGWWYGTNHSAQDTSSWLERACSCADLRWGYELKTSIGESASDVQKVSATHEEVFGSH